MDINIIASMAARVCGWDECKKDAFVGFLASGKFDNDYKALIAKDGVSINTVVGAAIRSFVFRDGIE